MKNIQAQYQDLLEGKMSKANFMVNVRREFPQWISGGNSFQDAVNILKSKRILSEGIHDMDVTSASHTNVKGQMGDYDPKARAASLAKLSKFGPAKMTSSEIEKLAYQLGIEDHIVKDLEGGIANTEEMLQLIKAAEKGSDEITEVTPNPSYRNPEIIAKAVAEQFGQELASLKHAASQLPLVSRERSQANREFENKALSYAFDLMLDSGMPQVVVKNLTYGYSDEDWPSDYITALSRMLKAGSDDEMLAKMGSKEDYFDPAYPGKSSILEAAKKPEGAYKQATGKVEYDKFAEMDRVHYRQLVVGTEFELLKMPEITDENFTKARKKAYKNLVKNPKAYMHLLITNDKDVEKKDKDLRMQPVKGDNKVDKANAMKVIKKDDGSNVQDNLGNKERAKSKNGEGLKHMTQTPKKAKGIDSTMEVPGKEKVLALKENILDEFMGVMVTAKEAKFPVGSEVVTPDGETGIVKEITPDKTCEVEIKGGARKHYQENVLKKHDSKIQERGDDDQAFKRWSSEKRGEEMRAAEVKPEETKGLKVGDIVKAHGKDVKITRFVRGEDGKIQIQGHSSPIGALSPDYYDIEDVTKVQEDKHAALKEKLVKALKELSPTDQQIDLEKKKLGLLYQKKGKEMSTGTQPT